MCAQEELVMEVDPMKVQDNQFNLLVNQFPFTLWDKSPLADQELARVMPVLDFIHDIIASGRADVRDYLLRWLALPLQKLGTKTGVCVVLHSDRQGTGKGLLARGLMRPIYGSGFYMCQKEEQLCGRFNNVCGKQHVH
jgi:hypothetical protein